MAYAVGNKCAKNLCKRTVLLQLIIENVVTFFGTQCRVIGLPYGEKNCYDMLSRFHLIPERNEQTDRQICYIKTERRTTFKLSGQITLLRSNRQSNFVQLICRASLSS